MESLVMPRKSIRETLDKLRAWCRIALRVPFMLPMAHVNPAMMIRARSVQSPQSLALLYGDQRFASRDRYERMKQLPQFFN